MKNSNVSVIFRSSKTPRILIELSPREAMALTEGHRNITANIISDITKALDWIQHYEQEEPENINLTLKNSTR